MQIYTFFLYFYLIYSFFLQKNNKLIVSCKKYYTFVPHMKRKSIKLIIKKVFLAMACTICFCSNSAVAQNYSDYFVDKTLRLDYQFVGDVKNQSVYLSDVSQLPMWAGRRKHLKQVPLAGDGQVTMRDKVTGDTIYRTSFSTLFAEWLDTEEAKSVPRAFENTYLMPFPKAPVTVTVSFRMRDGHFKDMLTHTVDPNDILIKKKGLNHITPYEYILKSGDPKNCIDVAFLAEGYTEAEMPKFIEDCKIALESFKEHEPFKTYINRFNFVAVKSVSKDSGVSLPRNNDWRSTAFNSHFDTFHEDRYLTSNSAFAVHDALAGIPYEHIIILANTDTYGGGGIYNMYTLTTAHHPKFRPVVVHEFGHSFGGLADEYDYGNDDDNTYPLNVEPWEKNITTKVDFNSKWADMVKSGKAGLYEGAGYRKTGIWRGSEDCRMKTNECKTFCPVCIRALTEMIKFYTE